MTGAQEIVETAYAKINLALHVRARRSDGYHELDTLFAFADDGDQLRIMESPELSLKIGGPFAAKLTNSADNLIMQTAWRIQDHYSIVKGASIFLEKNLPVASGIGGGSADAAAAARALNALWSLGASDAEMCSLLAPLGADIPACFLSKLARGQATGTLLTEIPSGALSGAPILLINPLQSVATSAVFARWDGIDRGPLHGSGALEIMHSGRNDLQPAAAEICPAIFQILAALSAHSPEIARMSGSGATCFAIFADDDQCEAARIAMSERFPAYWHMAAKIR